NELRGAGWSRVAAVLGGAAVMCAGATLLTVASAAQAPAGHAARGVAAALAAGALWGTMYIPYRKAYLTGMNPLAFVTFFTVGELGMMSALALADRGGVAALIAELSGARDVLFWLLLGGFVWVVGDLFQQYAAKYVGISRGIPLSNTNQLWGLVWGLLVFGEVRAGLAGESTGGPARRRTWLDWALVTSATAVFVALGLVARVPDLRLRWAWVAGLTLAMLALLGGTGILLWRTTRFN